MKNNKLLLFLAGIDVFAIIAKIIASFGEGYMITQGWLSALVIDILSVYILTTSTVKHKWVYILYGAVAYIALCCLLATLSMFGLAYMGW